jgi:hypothetical protein
VSRLWGDCHVAAQLVCDVCRNIILRQPCGSFATCRRILSPNTHLPGPHGVRKIQSEGPLDQSEGPKHEGPMPKLTDASSPRCPWTRTARTAWFSIGVRVTTKGTRTFIVQWTDPVTKRKVREPLGIWGSLSIYQAREAAKVRLGQVAKGINPRAERLRLKAEDDRERAEAALSFEALVDEWGQLHLAPKRRCAQSNIPSPIF